MTAAEEADVSGEQMICLVLYFYAVRDPFWLRPFWEFARSALAGVGTPITAWSLGEGRKDTAVREGRTPKTGSDGVERVVRRYEKASVSSFEVYAWPGRGQITMDADGFASMDFPCKWHASGNVTLIVRAQSACTTATWAERVRSVNTFADVRYGFVTRFPRSKAPVFYFGSDQGTNRQTKEERAVLRGWRATGRPNIGTRIRDTFWGNVISEGHVPGRKGALRSLARDLAASGALVDEVAEGMLFFAAKNHARKSIARMSAVLEGHGVRRYDHEMLSAGT